MSKTDDRDQNTTKSGQRDTASSQTSTGRTDTAPPFFFEGMAASRTSRPRK